MILQSTIVFWRSISFSMREFVFMGKITDTLWGIRRNIQLFALGSFWEFSHEADDRILGFTVFLLTLWSNFSFFLFLIWYNNFNRGKVGFRFHWGVGSWRESSVYSLKILETQNSISNTNETILNDNLTFTALPWVLKDTEEKYLSETWSVLEMRPQLKIKVHKKTKIQIQSKINDRW